MMKIAVTSVALESSPVTTRTDNAIDPSNSRILIWCWPLNLKVPFIIPWSFPNAIKLPVNEIEGTWPACLFCLERDSVDSPWKLHPKYNGTHDHLSDVSGKLVLCASVYLFVVGCYIFSRQQQVILHHGLVQMRTKLNLSESSLTLWIQCIGCKAKDRCGVLKSKTTWITSSKRSCLCVDVQANCSI